MNERIEKLAQDCFEYIEGTLDGDIVEFDYKKFAELLIRECAEQIKTQGISASSEDYSDYEIGFNAGLFHALRTTKEHFGVE
jgi:hypothetical protein